MKSELIYSCSTWLSYNICQHFYGEMHYAWCSPCFDAEFLLSPYNSIPPSSNPRTIYWNLKRDVEAADLHSEKITQIRNGIKKGAAVRHGEGMINRAQYQEIVEIPKRVQLTDFKPLMFVIPSKPVADMLTRVDAKGRAGLFSEEYIIKNLPRHLFDAIEL